MFTIFMYKLNLDSLSLKRCRFLAQTIIDTLNAADYDAMAFYEEEDFVRKFSDVGSLLMDWCYDDLPETMLHDLVRAQYAMNREFMNTFVLSASGNSYVSSHNAWNCVFTNQNALALYDAAGLSEAQKIPYGNGMKRCMINGLMDFCLVMDITGMMTGDGTGVLPMPCGR